MCCCPSQASPPFTGTKSHHQAYLLQSVQHAFQVWPNDPLQLDSNRLVPVDASKHTVKRQRAQHHANTGAQHATANEAQDPATDGAQHAAANGAQHAATDGAQQHTKQQSSVPTGTAVQKQAGIFLATKRSLMHKWPACVCVFVQLRAAHMPCPRPPLLTCMRVCAHPSVGSPAMCPHTKGLITGEDDIVVQADIHGHMRKHWVRVSNHSDLPLAGE